MLLNVIEARLLFVYVKNYCVAYFKIGIHFVTKIFRANFFILEEKQILKE